MSEAEHAALITAAHRDLHGRVIVIWGSPSTYLSKLCGVQLPHSSTAKPKVSEPAIGQNTERVRSQPPSHHFPDHTRRVTRDYCLAGHVRGYDAACGHYRAIADGHTGQDYRSGSDPHLVTDDDGLRARARRFAYYELVGVAVEHVGVPGNCTIRSNYNVVVADDCRIEIYIRFVTYFQMGIIVDQYKRAMKYLGIAVDGQPGIGAETQRTRRSRGVAHIEPKHQAGSRGDADLRPTGQAEPGPPHDDDPAAETYAEIQRADN